MGHTLNIDPNDPNSSNLAFHHQGPEWEGLLVFLSGKHLTILKYLVILNKSPGCRHIMEDHTDLNFSSSSKTFWLCGLGISFFNSLILKFFCKM